MQRNTQPQKNKMNSKYTIFSLIIIVLAGLVAQAVTKNREKNNKPDQPPAITTESQITVPDVTQVEITTEATTAQTTEATTASTPEVDDSQNTTAEITTETATEATTEVTQGKQYKFRKKSYRDQHFEKHGSEFDASFGYTTAEEYEAGASLVVNNPNALHKLEAEDGDDIYYLEETNEFVVISTDGYLRTYFRPSAGINYYNRQ